MANPTRQSAINGLKQGDGFSTTRTFSHAETLLFGDITRDYNPVHYDERWASMKGYRGVICHGLLIGSMICEFGGQVGWLATGMSFKFIKPRVCSAHLKGFLPVEPERDLLRRVVAEGDPTNKLWWIGSTSGKVARRHLDWQRSLSLVGRPFRR